MAKEAKPEAETADAGTTPPKKSMKLLIIVAAALVLILAIGGGAAYFLMKGHADPDGEDGEVATEKAKADKKKGGKEVAPVYVALEAFTVNLVPENGDQFLQLIISFEVTDLRIADKVKSYTPKLRNNIMLLLSGKKAAELITREGKQTLATEIRDLVNEILDPGVKFDPDASPVKEVLFTSFIIQ
ncbi:MAG: flagellar basal body-associated FliL family protein [Betaproteobacteria bacterium]